MAMNFGKNNRSVAFNPTSAFPLDARSYFESYDAAVAAALTAREAGSTDSVYYYGQTLVVVENNISTLYIIQPDNTLVPVTGEPTEEFNLIVDKNTFDIDAESNELKLKSFSDAAAGTVATKNIDGSLIWQTPIDAYSKAETDAKIAEAAHLKRKIVNNVLDIYEYIESNDDAQQYIFMVPAEESVDNNYDEYMVISIAGTLIVEKVGSWKVNLDDYATKNDLDKKVDKIEGSRLITDIEGQKLAMVNVEAEKNIINSVSTEFEINSDRQLSLKPITISKVVELQETLNSKVDIKDGHRLINPTEIEKLAKLSIDNQGNLGISGTVSIENVIGLQDWLNSNAAIVPGLSENNLSDDLYNQLIDQLFIKSIEESQMAIDENKKLSITAIDYSKVTGLNDVLALKADTSVVTELATKVGSLESSLNTYISNAEDRFIEIEDRLTWHGLNS